MNLEIRTNDGSTIDKNLDIPDSMGYGLLIGDEFSYGSYGCYVIVKKHFMLGDLSKAVSLTLIVRERKEYQTHAE